MRRGYTVQGVGIVRNCVKCVKVIAQLKKTDKFILINNIYYFCPQHFTGYRLAVLAYQALLCFVIKLMNFCHVCQIAQIQAHLVSARSCLEPGLTFFVAHFRVLPQQIVLLLV